MVDMHKIILCFYADIYILWQIPPASCTEIHCTLRNAPAPCPHSSSLRGRHPKKDCRYLHSPCICRSSATHISHTKYRILIPYTSLLLRHLLLSCFFSVICRCHTFFRYFPLSYFFSIRKMLCKSSALSSFGSSNSALSRKVKSHVSRFSLLV